MSLRIFGTFGTWNPFALICVLSLSWGCGGGGSTDGKVGIPAAVPTIHSFTASPSSISAGSSSTLTWSVTGATSLSIDHSVGGVTGTSITVSPSATTTYTLTATNDHGNTTRTTTVTIGTSASSLWCTAYYPTWSMQALGTSWQDHDLGQPPDQVDWTGVTHIVHFGNGNIISTETPYWLPTARPDGTAYGEGREWQYGGCTGSGCIDYQQQLISTAHAKGIKVVITIQAVDPTEFIAVTADAANTQILVNAIYDYVIQRGYDGVELDLEHWSGANPVWSDVDRFVRLMRQKLDLMNPRGLFLMSPGEFDFNNYTPSLDSLVDQYNLQTYAMAQVWNGAIGANGVWFINALYADIDVPPGSYCEGTGDQYFEGRAVDGSKAIAGREYGIDAWIKVGHDPKKLGVGLAAFSAIFRNNGDATKLSDQLYQAYYGGSGFNGDYQHALRLLTMGGVMHWDDNRKVHYITGTATQDIGSIWWGESGVPLGDRFFATFETPESLVYKVEWIKAKGIGGVMLYATNSDLDPSKALGPERNPLLSALSQAIH